MLVQKKELALRLRSEGKSYQEISTSLHVSKATLSYWLRNITLNQSQKEALSEKQRIGRLTGAEQRRTQRVQRENLLLLTSEREVSLFSNNKLWLLGTIAYWCEGAKQKNNNKSSRVIFTNSDPFLIKLLIKWAIETCGVEVDRILYNLCIHETGDVEKSLNYWSHALGISPTNFGKTIIKKHNISTNRLYVNDTYYGLLRITIRKSTDLNRRIKGWIIGLEKSLF